MFLGKGGQRGIEESEDGTGKAGEKEERGKGKIVKKEGIKDTGEKSG